MSRSQSLIDYNRDAWDKSGWKVMTDDRGITHPQYGDLYFHFNNFMYCCGAQEMGGLNFIFKNKRECIKALKIFLTFYRRSLLLATVNKKQDEVKDVLLEIGFKQLDNLKFKNKNSGNTVEVLCLRDRPFRKNEV